MPRSFKWATDTRPPTEWTIRVISANSGAASRQTRAVLGRCTDRRHHSRRRRRLAARSREPHAGVRRRRHVTAAARRRIQIDTQPLQPDDHLSSPADSVGSAPLQKCIEHRRFRREKISQHVHLAPGGRGGELAPHHDAEPELLSSRDSSRYTCDSIVVGEGDGPETRGQGTCDHRLGEQAPVGCGGVHVQIDRRAPAPDPDGERELCGSAAVPHFGRGPGRLRMGQQVEQVPITQLPKRGLAALGTEW